ncbi:DNA-processing protein DprA [Chitinimonas viridis]|uniref:DNA-processing protein DprA n=1 Tax=Chitinimonas viridis TaxID=664880 RepID=A0ABT8B988_9NEIS|nr:DNA-processing protein DprA [Chitinimonas viridis]MDN3578113.1 DNA-processing protein DprA [Chitinimonas viridis]
MRDTDSEDWLRLSLTPGMGPAHTCRLLAAFGTPAQVLAASQASLARHVPDKLAQALKQGPDPEQLARSLAWLDTPENRLLTLADSDYPSSLLEISDPPPVLYAKGQVGLLGSASLGVVGSRNATPQGVQNAEAFSRDLSQRGWCIVSGLALGIDTAAHRGGLSGPGSTIAVVGTGLDIVYPARNHALAHQIAAEGLILSEFALGTPGRAGNFPRRNRIISGLARGVLVVEAALQSGSLITAREAAEQGREVFAIPGSIHSTLSKGCHQLIKHGAKLVETAADILEELGAAPAPTVLRPTAKNPAAPADAAEASLLAALGHDPLDIDSLVMRANLTPDRVYAMLLTLELTGQVAKLPGGRYQRLA